MPRPRQVEKEGRAMRRIGTTVAAAGLFMLVGAGTSQAVTFVTPPLVPVAGGYLDCEVTATSRTPIGVVATVLAADGTNVTDFGTGFRSSPDVNGDGLYHADETAGSIHTTARYCTVTVSDARRKDVEVTLTSYDQNQHVVATVQAR
jgi:hypothetical protein